MTSPVLEVNCPTCKKKVTWEAKNTFRPFCSDRCQQIDLGAWANEEYNIPAPIQDEWSDLPSNTDESPTLQ